MGGGELSFENDSFLQPKKITTNNEQNDKEYKDFYPGSPLTRLPLIHPPG